MLEKKSKLPAIELKKSRWVLVSSLEGIPSDGVPGNGSPFTNSLIKALLDNSKISLSISELAAKLRNNSLEHQNAYLFTPGLGILNRKHEGGEFQFKIDKELIVEDSNESTNENVNSKILMKVLNELSLMNKRAIENEKKHENLMILMEQSQKMPTEKTQVLDKVSLINLISNNKIGQYFVEINNHIKEIDEQQANSLILLQGNWRSIKTEGQRNIISSQEQNLRENKLIISLLEITRELNLKTKTNIA
jgi:hypothetical protein